MRQQISRAYFLLKNGLTITIMGYGPSMEKAIKMAEIVKQRVGLLHQETEIVTKMFEPREEGKEDALHRKKGEVLSGVRIKLS